MGDPKGFLVDHINHDTLDCRRQNLRICSHIENVRNMKGPNSRNHSGFRGVHWFARQQEWRAAITLRGKRVYLGAFDTKEHAAEAYAVANKKYFGEFGGALR